MEEKLADVDFGASWHFLVWGNKKLLNAKKNKTEEDQRKLVEVIGPRLRSMMLSRAQESSVELGRAFWSSTEFGVAPARALPQKVT